jgi:hypothetical protein
MTGDTPRQQDPAEGDRATMKRELERIDRREARRGHPLPENLAARRDRPARLRGRRICGALLPQRSGAAKP